MVADTPSIGVPLPAPEPRSGTVSERSSLVRRPSTVLIVDDAPENLAVLSDVLADRYRVRAANSGARALQIVMTDPRPDIVLLDILMPGLDGYQVLEHMRADPRFSDTPVIFVTDMDTLADQERGLALGAVDYIIKPIQPGIVLARVRTHLELKHARDLLRDQNSFLEAEVASRMAETLLAADVSIRALARLAEVRDLETGNHILRTQSYVRTLAEQLKDHPRFAAVLTRPYIDLLAKSAPLHDIGKVGIPDAILRKPGKLTPDEWAVMMTHAKLGSDAIEQAERDAERPVAFLQLAKEIARWHHERWDGRGYPDGLAGEAIPVSARLMALADVFDAITTRRVYKEATPFEEAVRMIVAERGSHFDPDVVDAFVAQRDAFRGIAGRHAETGQRARPTLTRSGP